MCSFLTHTPISTACFLLIFVDFYQMRLKLFKCFLLVFLFMCVCACVCVELEYPPPSPTCFKLYWVWVQCACVRVCVCESSLVMFLYLKTLSIIVVNNNLFFLLSWNLIWEQSEWSDWRWGEGVCVGGGGNKLIVLHSLRHALT